MKGQVRLHETHTHEERFAGLLCRPQPTHRFKRNLPVGVGVIGDVSGLGRRPARIFPGLGRVFLFGFRSAVFRQGILGRLRLEMGNSPRGGVLAVAVSHVHDFAHGLGPVSVLLEILGHSDRIGPRRAEIGGEVVDPQRLRAQPGHQGIAGGRAHRLIAVGAVESQRAGGEGVNVRRLRVGVAVAAEDGLEVIDADEQHVGFRRFGLSGEGQCGEEKKGEKRFHAATGRSSRGEMYQDRMAAKRLSSRASGEFVRELGASCRFRLPPRRGHGLEAHATFSRETRDS